MLAVIPATIAGGAFAFALGLKYGLLTAFLAAPVGASFLAFGVALVRAWIESGRHEK